MPQARKVSGINLYHAAPDIIYPGIQSIWVVFTDHNRYVCCVAVNGNNCDGCIINEWQLSYKALVI